MSSISATSPFAARATENPPIITIQPHQVSNVPSVPPVSFESLSHSVLTDIKEDVAQVEDGISPATPVPTNDGSGAPQVEGDGDPDLGVLRLRQRDILPETLPPVPKPQPQPILHLLPRITYFQTDNVFSSVDPIADGLIFSSLMLWAAPEIRPGTYLSASIDGNLIRYLNESQFDYNFYRFRAGIRQRITPQMYGEIGWNNQQFFRAGRGDRFLNEHSAYLSLSRRDLLNQRLVLDSYYDFRVSFADPSDRSRVINSLYLSLSYYFQRNLQVGLDYQFNRSDFTEQDRQDQFHRILGRVTYGVLSDSQISVQGGVSIGDSSNPFIDFDSLFFSVTYSVDFPIF